MCGICGIVGSNQPAVVEAMVAAMHHRGPDDSGTYHDEHLALGMTRLAILDLSPAGHQPMSTSEGNLWIVFNGEIYNFQAERDLLEKVGYRFASGTDTEVILRMYQHYGDDFLLRLRGMFALALYDKDKDRLLIARDQMGIKPLLYTEQNGRLLFASEIKALLATDIVRREINPDALRQLLTFGAVIQPNTILDGVYMLPPAHRMIIERGQRRIERYWRLDVDRRPELRGLPYEEQVKLLADAIDESVTLQMVSDVPLGAFLSGGVDSSILVALMAQKMGKRLKTFSVGFEADGQTFDEREIAQRTADHVGTDHTAVLVRANEVRDQITQIAAGLDQPTVDGVNTYFVAQAARQGMTVAISGTGGDELFAGYPWFWHMAAKESQGAFGPSFKGTVARMLPNSRLLKRGGTRMQNWRQRGHFLEEYVQTYHLFGTVRTAQLLHPTLRAATHAGRTHSADIAHLDELRSQSAVERVTGLCLRGYTTNQLLRDIDAASMTHSLEVRVPYLDPVLADIALSLPTSTKLSRLNITPQPNATYDEIGAKRILIDAGRSLLPPDFGKQPKRGFTLPFGAWMQTTLRDVLEDTLSDKQIRQRGLLDVEQVAGVRTNFLAGHTPWIYAWTLMMLELWQREVLDRPAQILQHLPDKRMQS